MYLTKSEPGHVMPKLCFCIRWERWDMYCIPVGPGHEMSTHYFSCSGGTSTDLTKTVPGHIKLNLCFCIQWDVWVT
jgi:hypothetical protein